MDPLVNYGVAGVIGSMLVAVAVKVYGDVRRDLRDERAAHEKTRDKLAELGESNLKQFAEHAADARAQNKDLIGLLQAARVDAAIQVRRLGP
jgi:hypothetical protein